jgi:hypothetical protein
LPDKESEESGADADGPTQDRAQSEDDDFKGETNTSDPHARQFMESGHEAISGSRTEATGQIERRTKTHKEYSKECITDSLDPMSAYREEVKSEIYEERDDEDIEHGTKSEFSP